MVRVNSIGMFTLVFYCIVCTVVMLNRQTTNKIENGFDDVDASWLERPHIDSTNSSFLRMNTGVAIDNLLLKNPRDVKLSPNASDFDIVEAFPDSFPLSGGLSRPIPRYRVGKIPAGKKIIFGIASIRREGQDYLVNTLKSLLRHMSPVERKHISIVVFLGEEKINDYLLDRIEFLRESFQKEVDDGILEVISPSPAYYPVDWMKVLRPSFGDTVDRVKWRSKQNLDQMFLMMYVFHLQSEFYLMLEDDIETRDGFVNFMVQAIEKQNHADWFYISFCQLGAIGKLFKSSVLPAYTGFIQTFWNAKPLDWLQVDFVRTKICSYDEDLKKCYKRMSISTPQFTPSLFQHVGKVSSLVGKIQKLTDNKFRS